MSDLEIPCFFFFKVKKGKKGSKRTGNFFYSFGKVETIAE